MTDSQLYLIIGMPTLAVLVGILVNVSQFAGMNSRFNALEARFDGRMTSMETRLDARMSSLEAKFDILVGKVIEVDNRLTRVEERLKH